MLVRLDNIEMLLDSCYQDQNNPLFLTFIFKFKNYISQIYLKACCQEDKCIYMKYTVVAFGNNKQHRRDLPKVVFLELLRDTQSLPFNPIVSHSCS